VHLELDRSGDAAAQSQARAEPAQFRQPATAGFYDGFDPDAGLPTGRRGGGGAGRMTSMTASRRASGS
jgi:hypothetical protein